MKRMRGRAEGELGAGAVEYAALLLVVLGLVGAVVAARSHEHVAESVRMAVCQIFRLGSCEDTALGDAGEPGTGQAAPGAAEAMPSGGGAPGQTSLIADGPLAVTPAAVPSEFDPDEDTSNDQAWWTDNGPYGRQNATFQDREFRVRGYLNPTCLRAPVPCTSVWGNRFRAEYTAQAHAIRALSNIGGRLSWAERWLQREAIDNNVHWEVGPNGSRWRIDILVHDPDTGTDTIVEVKRYRGPQTSFDVEEQLFRYERNMYDHGVTVTRNRELTDSGWAVTYTQPPSLGDRFRFRSGTQWFAWADPDFAGHIYFAPGEDTPAWVKEKAVNTDDGGFAEFFEEPVPIFPPIPIRPPVPVPVVP